MTVSITDAPGRSPSTADLGTSPTHPAAPGAVDPALGAVAELVRHVESRRAPALADAGARLAPAAPPTHDATDGAGAEPPPLSDAIVPELGSFLAQANGDPLLLFALVDAAFRASQVESNVQDVESTQRTAEQAALEREAAIDRAIDAADRQARMPKWLKKLLKAIAIVASTVAAAFTGGALAAVAIAGIVLTLSAEKIGDLAVRLGMDPGKAKWLTFGLTLVGGAMSAVAGGVASAGAGAAAPTIERVATLTSNVIGGASDVLSASEEIASGVFRHRAEGANLDAERAAIVAEVADADAEDALRGLRDGMRSVAHAAAARDEILQLRADAMRAVLARAV